MEVASTKDGQFVCSYCGKQRNKNKNLRQHVKQEHPGSELPKCQPVGRPKSSLLPPQPPRNIMCTICSRSFAAQRGLKLHQMVVHKLMYIRSQAVTMEFSSVSGEFVSYSSMICILCAQGRVCQAAGGGQIVISAT